MDKFSANKLDNLFKEQFSDAELPLEEDYWPGIEKGLGRVSFYKFGWRHLNIYQISIGLLALLLPIVYLSNKTQGEEEKLSPTSVIAPDSAKDNSDAVVKPDFASPKSTKITKEKNIKSNNTKVNTADTAIIPVKEEIAEPVIASPEPAPPVIEEKPKKKPKQIIYVVQQDTIIQKDTVKVRRKKKN